MLDGLLRLPLAQPVVAAWRAWRASIVVRDVPACHKSDAENFAKMRLLARRHFVDEDGRWWLEEVRQCLWTGLRLRRTRRITD